MNPMGRVNFDGFYSSSDSVVMGFMLPCVFEII